MNLLLHICCGPCSIYPISVLRQEQIQVRGYFYRNNIHPYTECLRREETLLNYAAQIDLEVIVAKDYDLEGFLRTMMFREQDRCRFCYYERLRATALIAKNGHFDGFSTTLLYSRFQKHEAIRSIGESIAEAVGIPFLYRDFRAGWRDGISESKRLGMYRQPYCGCIYSEKERYFKPRRKSNPSGQNQR